jgi:hypothetical protein
VLCLSLLVGFGQLHRLEGAKPIRWVAAQFAWDHTSLPSAWSAMITPTWYCSHSDNSAVPVNPRADTPDPILDGAHQHLVSGTTDIFAEQLADIIAEQ